MNTVGLAERVLGACDFREYFVIEGGKWSYFYAS